MPVLTRMVLGGEGDPIAVPPMLSVLPTSPFIAGGIAVFTAWRW